MSLGKGEIWTEGQTHVEKDEMKKHGEKIAIYKPRREAWNRSAPHSSQRELNLSHLDFKLLASRTGTIHFCCLSHPICHTHLCILSKWTHRANPRGQLTVNTEVLPFPLDIHSYGRSFNHPVSMIRLCLKEFKLLSGYDSGLSERLPKLCGLIGYINHHINR